MVLLPTLLIVGLLISAFVGWKLRSFGAFFGLVVVVLVIAALMPQRGNQAIVAERKTEILEVADQSDENGPKIAPSASVEESEVGGPEKDEPAEVVSVEDDPQVNRAETAKRASDSPWASLQNAMTATPTGSEIPPGTFASFGEDLTLAKFTEQRPIEIEADGFVGSDACIECHPNNHSTWDASYHSKMTQVADEKAVLGDFIDRRVVSQGREYFLTKKDGVCLVDMPDEKDPSKRIQAPIVMTTGSHHMQVYWFATGNRRSIGMLPIVYLNESDEWIPRQAAFLVPPNLPPNFEMSRWNSSCSSCHSTHRRGRRLANGDWDTHVAEFAISCEACHGPGKSHIEYQRGIEANVEGLAKDEDPIVNPVDLDHVASSQVCGQCHSMNDVHKMDLDWQENGHGYRPGKDLTETHDIWVRESPEHRLTMAALDYPDLDSLLDETYYPDGMVRVSGREFNGTMESECYLNGEMSCLTCHKMHQSEEDPRDVMEWANDQLDHRMLENEACTQCHQAEEYGTEHTHHAADSSGSSCYNCHMPHTSYGLLKAIRSHKIFSPDVGADRANRRPNACNLCHLDKTLEWAGEHVEEWYGIEAPELEQEEKEIAASVLWILKGDAAMRSITAWHMGWDEALKTSGSDWQLPFLAALLDDEYEAIRLVSRRTIQKLPGLTDLQLDVVTSSSSEEREQKGVQALAKWFEQESTKKIDRPELLIRDGGVILVDKLRSLIDERDNRRVYLSE